MCTCCEKSDLSRLTPVFEAFAGDDHALICLEVIGVHIDETYLADRTGDQGVLFNIHHPQNPELTEKTGHDYAGIIQKKIDMGEY